MKITVNGKTYDVLTEESTTLRDIESILPLTLQMKCNHDVEYVGELPIRPVNDGRQISKTETDGIYYYEGWNVLCLNYRANDISPYTVTYLGRAADASLAEELEKAGDELTVTIEKTGELR